MFKWLRRRRLSANAQKKLMILHARSEEAIIVAHVNNLLDLIDTLAGEVELDRAIELYAEMMSLDEAQAETVTTRLLAQIDNPSARTGRYRNVFRERR